MEDVDRGLSLASLDSEDGRDIKKIASASFAATTTTTGRGIDGSMVIYVQQKQQELPVSLTSAGSSNSTEQQLDTLMPQNLTDRVNDNVTSPEQPQPLPEEDMVVSLLGSVVTNSTGDDTLLSQQQAGVVHAEDGQILCVTYIVNPTLDEVTDTQQPPASEISQRMVLHVADDGTTLVLPAENVEVGGFDIESGLVPHLTVNGMYTLATNDNLSEESLTSPLVLTSDLKNISKEEARLKNRPFIEINDRRRTEQVIGSELHIEEKLEVLDAMLTPAPERPRKKKLDSVTEDGEGSYMCDLCETTFPRANQFYGHLHSHSGERKWECAICPHKAVFPSQALLRRHERESHLNLRPYTCAVCAARFDRVSQLSYHQRRIHAGERGHACQICHKAFFKRSDLKTHLNIHLGINKCICETCGKKFNHVSNLIRHTRMHSGIKPYPCTVCGRRFTQLSALHQHKTSHQTNKDVACSICRKMFKSHMVMRKHVRQFHKDKLAASGKDINSVLKIKDGAQSRRFYCKVCGENFEFSALLRQHERQHEKETSFHCSCCGQDYDTVELLKSHSCLTPEERLQKQAEDEAEAERVSLNSQLESLLQEHSGAEERNDANGNSGIMSEIVIYVTQEGQDEPTQVHIQPMPGPILGHIDEQKPLILVPSTDLGLQKNGADSQHKQSHKDIVTLGDSGGTCKMETDLDAAPLQLEFCSSGMTVGNGDKNNRSDRADCTNSSPLFPHNMVTILGGDSSSDNFATGGDVLGEPSHDSDCDNGMQNVTGMITVPNKGVIKTEEYVDLLIPKIEASGISSESVPVQSKTVSAVKKQVRVYQCPECPKTFVKNSNFKQHLGIHFIDQQHYHCPTCGQYFAWKSTLNKHMHTHSIGPLPRYRCDLCSKEYAAPTQVQEHIKRDHYKQRPHACVVCGKTFYKKYDLKIHVRTHTKERPYICGTCGKSFYHLSHIIRHERIHSGHRPYHCPDCGRQFNQSSSLKNHRQRHNQCVTKAVPPATELAPLDLIQPEFPDIGPDSVPLYTGTNL